MQLEVLEQEIRLRGEATARMSSTANWAQAQSSFFTFNPLDFCSLLQSQRPDLTQREATAMTAANKALMLQACPPATSGPFALV